MNVVTIIAGVVIIAFSIGSLYYISTLNNAVTDMVTSITPTSQSITPTAPTIKTQEPPVAKEETVFSNKPWCSLGMHGEKPMCVKVPSTDLCGSGIIYLDEKECNADTNFLGKLRNII